MKKFRAGEAPTFHVYSWKSVYSRGYVELEEVEARNGSIALNTIHVDTKKLAVLNACFSKPKC